MSNKETKAEFKELGVYRCTTCGGRTESEVKPTVCPNRHCTTNAVKEVKMTTEQSDAAVIASRQNRKN